jgi:hypothetical protein
MAFCNACGATIEPGAKFCPKCGAAVPAAAVASTPATPAQSNAVKVILIVVAIVVGLSILGIGTATFVAWRVARYPRDVARNTRVEQNGGKVRVETPFGTVESNDNSDEAARNLGIDIYPGARARKSSAANVTMGAMHTIAAEFETDDPPERVADFYKKRLPHANIAVSDEKQYTIISHDKKNMFTINIEPQDGKTLIHIANISGNAVAGGESTD